MHSEDPFRPHAHDPNLEPPAGDGSFVLRERNGRMQTITLPQLKQLPYAEVADCFIVSTGHGTSGPFIFGGVSIADFMIHFGEDEWSELEVVSVDGFGNRILAAEVGGRRKRPFLLAYTLNGQELSREAGLLRLIVPQETDDALRQVKWIGEIRVL